MNHAALLLLLLASCRPTFPGPTQPAARTAARVAPVAPSISFTSPRQSGTLVLSAAAIAGEWRVAGIDGQSVDQQSAITATIGHVRMRFVSQCIVLQWDFSLSEGALRTRRADNDFPNCVRALSADERRLEHGMDSATRAARLPNNALLLSGPGGLVILFTQ